MKRKYLIGNMKMNMSYEQLVPYFKGLKVAAEETDNIVGICVPSCYLDLAKQILDDSKVLYGAENMYYKDAGAYTGEISAKMINDFNAEYVIIGHSERRQYFHETNEDVNLKIKKALEFGLKPIVCFGESEQERENNQQLKVVKDQIESALSGIEKSQIENIIFAYEPIWAIGTGKTATSDQAEEIAEYSKSIIVDLLNVTKQDIVLLYGGSMKPANAFELLSKPDIDGGLIGGACLKVEDFKGIFDIIVK